jgi:hypothetical protein
VECGFYLSASFMRVGEIPSGGWVRCSNSIWLVKYTVGRRRVRVEKAGLRCS